MAELTEDQELVLDIVKQWMIELDASFLAREELIVYWGPLNGNIRNHGWVKLKLHEAVSILRTTKVSISLMKLCTNEIVRFAAQEEGRAFIAGVSQFGKVAPGYFNYQRRKVHAAETVDHHLAAHIIAVLECMGNNVLWKDLAFMYEQGLKYLKRELPHAMARNNLLRWGLKDSAYVEKRNSKQYNGRYTFRENGKLRQVICIKLPHRSGIKEDWTPEQMRSVILEAVKNLRSDNDQ